MSNPVKRWLTDPWTMSDCFFYSAVLVLLSPNELELRKGPPNCMWDTAHFFCLDRRTGQIVDPTQPERPAKGPGDPVDAFANLDAVLGHPLFLSLPGAIQGRLRALADQHCQAI